MKSPKKLELLLKHLKTNKNALAKELSISASTFRNIETGRNGISAKIAKNITDKYPEVNFDWLMGGDCPMLVEPKVININDSILKQMEASISLVKGYESRLEIIEHKLGIMEI